MSFPELTRGPWPQGLAGSPSPPPWGGGGPRSARPTPCSPTSVMRKLRLSSHASPHSSCHRRTWSLATRVPTDPRVDRLSSEWGVSLAATGVQASPRPLQGSRASLRVAGIRGPVPLCSHPHREEPGGGAGTQRPPHTHTAPATLAPGLSQGTRRSSWGPHSDSSGRGPSAGCRKPDGGPVPWSRIGRGKARPPSRGRARGTWRFPLSQVSHAEQPNALLVSSVKVTSRSPRARTGWKGRRSPQAPEPGVETARDSAMLLSLAQTAL